MKKIKYNKIKKEDINMNNNETAKKPQNNKRTSTFFRVIFTIAFTCYTNIEFVIDCSYRVLCSHHKKRRV